MSTLLVTGADGFIGSAVTALLATHGHTVRATVRNGGARGGPHGIQVHAIGDLEGHPDWSAVLDGTDCVIHLAGRAHVVRDRTSDSTASFHQINVEPSVALFRASVRARVRRFVFVSSIGVLGVASGAKPFDASSKPHPTEAYAISKWQAERELSALAATSGTELVIVRPTLVCGAGAKGNFERLVRLVKRGLPLPLGSVRGVRNFVGLASLSGLLELCSTHPAAAGQTFLAADPETYTTPQLIHEIAAALSIPPRLLPCPPVLLRLAGLALGRQAEVDRLTDSLVVDASFTRAALGWRNTRPLREEIVAMARAAHET